MQAYTYTAKQLLQQLGQCHPRAGQHSRHGCSSQGWKNEQTATALNYAAPAGLGGKLVCPHIRKPLSGELMDCGHQ